MVGCGRIEGASVQDLSNTKDAIVESETTLAENNNEYSNKNSLFYSDISSYEIFTDVNSEAALKNLYYNIDEFIDSDSSDVIVKGNIIEIEYVYIDGCSYSVLTVDVERAYKGEVQETITVYEDGGYTRLSDEKEQIEAHADLSQYTEEEMENLLINHTFMGDSYRINCSVFGRYTLNKDSYIRPEFIVENDNPEKITTYSNMDTFEFSVSKSMLEDKLSQQ